MSVSWPFGLAALLLLLLAAAVLWAARAGRDARRLRQRLRAADRNLEDLQTSFSRFAPDDVVERILARGISTGAERKEVTALFADLVGFTALSERVEPPVLLRMLNGYFEHMSDAIAAHRGHLSTFIGDGILALFGALRPNPWQGDDAVHAALAMRRALADYNKELLQQGLPALSVGIGIHRGVGVTGLVGSRELMQFAFVGRTVNLAARVQDLTRGLPGDILVTRAVAERLDRRFVRRAMPPAEVRGIDAPVETFAIERFES
jgi:adenylate cyclase